MSAARNVTEACCNPSTRDLSNRSIGHSVVPEIHLSDSQQVNDEFSGTSKRLRTFSRKQCFRPNTDKLSFSKYAPASPSPLSSSPDSRSGSPVRPSSHLPINHFQMTRSGGSAKHQHIGFCPIHGIGLTRDSNNSHSGDSEVESSLTSFEKKMPSQLLYTGIRSNLERTTNFRRHSWIWYDTFFFIFVEAISDNT